MSVFLELTAELAAMAAVLLATYLVLLATRHPTRPRWIDREFTASMVTITLISLMIVTLALFIKGMISHGLDPLASLAIAIASFAVIAGGLWKAIGMRARLKAAREGRSPFAPAAKPGRVRGGGAVGQA